MTRCPAAFLSLFHPQSGQGKGMVETRKDLFCARKGVTRRRCLS